MCELSDIDDDIKIKRDKQKVIKKTIAENILRTYRFYDKTEKYHFFRYNIKLDNYKLTQNGVLFKLYIKKKCILSFERCRINEYQYHDSRVDVVYFDNTSILEMQDFNDKLVEVVKTRLLTIKNKEEDEAIEMIA